MRDFLVILLHWREVAELLHDLAHGLCAVSDPHHVHADNHERNMRRRAVALFNRRGLTMRAAELGDSAASQALSQPEVLSTQRAESTPAPIR